MAARLCAGGLGRMIGACALGLALATGAGADTLVGYSIAAGGVVEVDWQTGGSSLLVSAGGGVSNLLTTGAADRFTGHYATLLFGSKGVPESLLDVDLPPPGGSQSDDAGATPFNLLYGPGSTLYGITGDSFSNFDVGSFELNAMTGQYEFSTVLASSLAPNIKPATGPYAMDVPGGRYFFMSKNASTGYNEVVTVDLSTGGVTRSDLSDQTVDPTALGYLDSSGQLFVLGSEEDLVGGGTHFTVRTLDPTDGSLGSADPLTDATPGRMNGFALGPSPVDQADGLWHWIGTAEGYGLKDTVLFTYDLAASSYSTVKLIDVQVAEFATVPSDLLTVPVPEPGDAWVLALACLAIALRHRA